MDLDTDAIRYLNEQMLCSVELANKLVHERGLIPYPIALRLVVQIAGANAPNIEVGFLSAIRRDKIRIAEVSDNPGRVHIGGLNNADWQTPSIEILDFHDISLDESFDKRSAIQHELSRSCYKDVEPPDPDHPPGAEYPIAGRGFASEQAIYLFDTIEIRDWAQMQYPPKDKKKTGGRSQGWPWDDAMRFALALMVNKGDVPETKAQIREYLKDALELMGYKDDMPGENTYDPYRDKIYEALSRTNEKLTKSKSRRTGN